MFTTLTYHLETISRLKSKGNNSMIKPIVLVHGGAGDIPESRVPLKLDGVRRAARAGYESLSKPNGSVLDAVEGAVKVMEDDEAFNAGSFGIIF